MVQLVGVAGGADPSKTELVDVSWDTDQIVTMRFSQSDGADTIVELETSDEHLDNQDGAVRMILTQDGELKRPNPRVRD